MPEIETYKYEIEFSETDLSINMNKKSVLECSINDAYRIYKLLQGVLKNRIEIGLKPRKIDGSHVKLSDLNIKHT